MFTWDQWLLSFCLRSVSRSSLSWSHSFIRPWACSTLPSIPAASASLTRLLILFESRAICSWLRCVCCGDNDDGYDKTRHKFAIIVIYPVILYIYGMCLQGQKLPDLAIMSHHSLKLKIKVLLLIHLTWFET